MFDKNVMLKRILNSLYESEDTKIMIMKFLAEEKNSSIYFVNSYDRESILCYKTMKDIIESIETDESIKFELNMPFGKNRMFELNKNNCYIRENRNSDQKNIRNIFISGCPEYDDAFYREAKIICDNNERGYDEKPMLIYHDYNVENGNHIGLTYIFDEEATDAITRYNGYNAGLLNILSNMEDISMSGIKPDYISIFDTMSVSELIKHVNKYNGSDVNSIRKLIKK